MSKKLVNILITVGLICLSFYVFRSKSANDNVTEDIIEDTSKLESFKNVSTNNNKSGLTVIENKTMPPSNPANFDNNELPEDLKKQLESPPPELPEDLKRQLEMPPQELPDDLKAQLAASPPPLPADIQESLKTPPRVVTIEEVNGIQPETNKE